MTVWLPCIATGTGAEVWTRRLAEALAARGIAAQLDLIPHRFQYCPWAARLRPPADCTVTVANSWSAAAFAGAAPLVTVVHHVVHEPAFAPFRTIPQALFHTGFVGPMERAALRRSAAVIAVSESTRRAVEAEFGFAAATTVLNGVDTAFFTPADQPVERAGPLKLLFVGKPSRRKRFDLVASLAAELGEAAQVTVIGSGPEPGLSCPQAEWRGRVTREALREAYRQADFLLLPSRIEGFGYAAAEAMACGTPVVCAPHGAVAEIARPGEAAIAVGGGDIRSLARALTGARSDDAGYAAMRAHARRIAERDLSETRWLDEMIATLERAASARVAPSLRVPTASLS
jgi:glycosyltransferase involved in cell wall biosynthesis